MASFRLSKLAQRDLLRIARQSEHLFGAAQAQRHHDQLEACCESLADLPATPSRVHSAVFWVACGSHVIYYTLRLRTPWVVRILHKRQLPERHL